MVSEENLQLTLGELQNSLNLQCRWVRAKYFFCFGLLLGDFNQVFKGFQRRFQRFSIGFSRGFQFFLDFGFRDLQPLGHYYGVFNCFFLWVFQVLNFGGSFQPKRLTLVLI